MVNAKNLSVLAYANGFTLWHYVTTDTADHVGAGDYFKRASDMLRVGDMIIANLDTDGTPAAGIYFVASNNGGIVVVVGMGASK